MNDVAFNSGFEKRAKEYITMRMADKKPESGVEKLKRYKSLKGQADLKPPVNIKK